MKNTFNCYLAAIIFTNSTPSNIVPSNILYLLFFLAFIYMKP